MCCPYIHILLSCSAAPDRLQADDKDIPADMI